MNLTFKTVSQDVFRLAVEPTETVLQVKKRIEDQQGFSLVSQKLIYSGKILNDSKTIGSYGVTEKGFIVLMVPKARTPGTRKPIKKKESISKDDIPVNTAPSAPPAAAVAQAPSTTTAPVAAASSSSASTTSKPQEHDLHPCVKAQMSGEKRLRVSHFLKDEVNRALNASSDNPENDMEDHPMEIPEGVQPMDSDGDIDWTTSTSEESLERFKEFAAAAAATSFVSDSPLHQKGDAPGAAVYRILEESKEFQHLRSVTHSRPEIVPQLLDHIRTTFPQFWKIVSHNPKGFVNLLSKGLPIIYDGDSQDEEDDEDEDEDEFALDTEEEAIYAQDEGEPGVRYIPGSFVHPPIRITVEEEEAICRLQELGFTKHEALVAYLACDKDEALAASYLFEQSDEDM
ncbi:hypothetical protein BJ684DRAFT_14569 [Piptocephalis cylindrospora]|uniref:UV excision repair protein RAD23 n=1 Tax=Piptocephalis cylindrospora TaxID=1907219 RepID=A0A4P9Y9N7_9FUNG|nr:hypothetical protein BJ684DRAFT_14569 [Piptocephalis cylindrospora]|eukprot:RKP15151.1 hypothetical protein BJ684DRAFT_14569 [Piptocephalis cylindrospora]